MVSLQLCIFLLSVSLSGKTLSTSVVSAEEQAQSNFVDTSKRACDDIQRLESSIAELRKEIKAKRCESGGIGFTPHTQPGVLFSDGSVRRIHSVHVNFSRVFATKPWVSVGITHLDVFNNANVRIDVAVDAISTSGFDALAYEWADTHNVLVFVSWVACNI